MRHNVLLIAAWAASFGLCYACLATPHLYLWWAGLIVFVVGIFATRAYRGGDKIEWLWLVCYALLWPFFSPMLGYQRSRQRKVRVVLPKDLKDRPFKLEL